MTPKERADLANAVAKDWVAKGKLIEGGFAAMRIITLHPDAAPEQVDAMRMAFFGGAQHLFGSIMGILDPGKEPTKADLKRMTMIADELDNFIKEFKRQHNIRPPQETEH